MSKLHQISAFLLLTASAFAQKRELRTFQRVESPPRDGGVYHVATGTWTRPGTPSSASSTLVSGTLDTIYAATAPSGYFFAVPPNAVITASGRIPSTSSPNALWNPAAIPDGSQPGSASGCANSYQVDAFRIGYCTNENGPTVSMSIAFHESWTPLCVSAPPLVPTGGPFLLNGLPGRGTAASSCWTIAIDLSGTSASFAMQADGDGVYSLGSDDAFGWSFSFPSATATTAATGPLLAGAPSDATGPGSACQPAHPGVGWSQFPPGISREAAGYDARRFDDPTGSLGACAPTYPANGSSFAYPPLAPAPLEFGSDMLGDDAFRVDGAATYGSGCHFFGGPVSGSPPSGPYANFQLELFAKVNCATAPIGFAYCAGDGLSSPPTTPCPCANFGAAGNGCGSSFNPAGANLAITGSVVLNNLVLHGSGMQTSGICVFLKGDAIDPNGFTFGDGISCTGGSLVRLRAVALSAGSAAFPVPPETITLSARGGNIIGSGQLASYVTYYRNAAASFCPPATFNSTNAQLITW